MILPGCCPPSGASSVDLSFLLSQGTLNNFSVPSSVTGDATYVAIPYTTRYTRWLPGVSKGFASLREENRCETDY